MADVAFGVVGVVGVALQSAQGLYDFLSSIQGAPHQILSLSSHVKNLKDFLEPFHDLISKPAVRNRPQNISFLLGVEHTAADFQQVLDGLQAKVNQYVRLPVGPNTSPVWGGFQRSIRYALSKSSIVGLEASLLSRMSALHLTLAPMDLSWTTGLSVDDHETINMLQQRAPSLRVSVIGDSLSTVSLASNTSIRSWAGIDDAPITQYHDRYRVLQSHVSSAEGHVSNDAYNSARPVDAIMRSFLQQRSQQGEDDPWGQYCTLWSGDDHIDVGALIDSGSSLNFIWMTFAAQLNAPINRHRTQHFNNPMIRTFSSEPEQVQMIGTVTLVCKFEGHDNFTEIRFHVLPDGPWGKPKKPDASFPIHLQNPCPEDVKPDHPHWEPPFGILLGVPFMKDMRNFGLSDIASVVTLDDDESPGDTEQMTQP